MKPRNKKSLDDFNKRQAFLNAKKEARANSNYWDNLIYNDEPKYNDPTDD